MQKNRSHLLLSFRQNFGLCLVFIGVTSSMYLNTFFPILGWTPLIMFLSCLLLCDKTTLKGGTRWNDTFRAIIYFQLFMLVYLFLFFNTEADAPWTKQLSFHLYIITLAVILMRTPSLKDRNFIPLLLVISSVLAIIGAVCHYLDLFRLARQLAKNGGESKVVLEVFAANIAVYVNFVCCVLLFSTKKKLLSLFLLVMVAVDIYSIIQSGKRSYFVSIFLVCILYLHKLKHLVKGTIIVLFIFLVLFALVPVIQEAVIELIGRTIDGFTHVYGEQESGMTDWNDSASIRVYLQQLAINKFYNFNFINLLFGGGYLCCFFDNPLGESYLDMGIIGFLAYTYLVVVVPVKFFAKINHNNKKELYCFFLALMNICIIITNNDPYIYITYTPLSLMALYSYKSDFYRFKHPSVANGKSY